MWLPDFIFSLDFDLSITAFDFNFQLYLYCVLQRSLTHALFFLSSIPIFLTYYVFPFIIHLDLGLCMDCCITIYALPVHTPYALLFSLYILPMLSFFLCTYALCHLCLPSCRIAIFDG